MLLARNFGAQNYNGTGNSDDVPGSLTLDTYGNVYVTGASYGTNTMTDFATLKINGQNGNIIWTSRYDFSNKYDGGTQVKLDNQGNVLVCGSSAQNLVNADFVLIKYNADNGNQLQIKRHNTPQNGYDIPIGMEIDASNNVYVVGTANSNLVNKNIKIIAYSSNLQINWVNYIDENGLEDEVFAIAKNAYDEILLTGSTKSLQNEIQTLTAKINKLNGSIIWKKVEQNPAEVSKAVGKGVAADPDGNTVIVSEIRINNIWYIKTVSYDPNGEKRWERINENPEQMHQKALAVLVNGKEVILTGTKETAAGEVLTTIKLEEQQVKGEFVTDANGNPMYARRHLIIRFQKDALKLETIDNLDIQFGKSETFLQPEAVDRFNQAIKPKNGAAVDFNSIIFYRVYRGMKSTETTATSHLGEEIEIPALYSAFLVEFPDGFEAPDVANQLPGIFPTVIYSDPVLAKIPLTDDTHYPVQSSLHPTAQYPNADINVEEAWNYEVGKPFIKVGVFDNGIMWEHEDFGTSQPNQSNVKKSYDFITNSDESSIITDHPNSHGTSCAGIIGGLRNNGRGIAGVAGGTGHYNSAVSLYSLRILELPYGDIITDEFEAIYFSTQSNPTPQQPYRYGLNIQSHSWRYLFDLDGGPFDDENLDLLRDNLRLASRFKTTIVAGKGNEGADTLVYPASMDDDWVLTVGGTGSDGEYWDGINDGGGIASGNFGFDVDIAAPASSLNVYTTATNTQNSYAPFDGTSSATPHVAGTVALLMSNYNASTLNYNNLTPEDCEQIIQLSATDVGTTYYDPYTGYGRLNAGKALVLLDPALFTLRHIKTDMFPTTKQIISMTPENSYEEVTLLESYTSGDNISYSPQTYHVRQFKIRHDVQHNIAVDTFFRASWTRPSSSNVLGDFNANHEIRPRERVQFEALNNEHAVLFGFVYAVYNTSNQFLGWWPRDVSYAFWNLEYSVLLTEDLNAGIFNLDLKNKIELFPNPANTVQTLTFDLSHRAKLEVSLVDLKGKEVMNVFSGNTEAGKTTFQIDVSNLSDGLYVYKIMLDHEIKYLKTQKL